VLVNGEPGLLITSVGVLDDVVAVDLNAHNRIEAIRVIRKPGQAPAHHNAVIPHCYRHVHLATDR
jgi:hypothetical protein